MHNILVILRVYRPIIGLNLYFLATLCHHLCITVTALLCVQQKTTVYYSKAPYLMPKTNNITLHKSDRPILNVLIFFIIIAIELPRLFITVSRIKNKTIQSILHIGYGKWRKLSEFLQCDIYECAS